MTRIEDPREREVEVLRRFATFEGMDVLDVGCGDGRTTRRIARTADSVVGVDPDSERIAQARAAGREDGSCDLELLVGDIVTLAFSDRAFDAVVFTRSL